MNKLLTFSLFHFVYLRKTWNILWIPFIIWLPFFPLPPSTTLVNVLQLQIKGSLWYGIDMRYQAGGKKNRVLGLIFLGRNTTWDPPIFDNKIPLWIIHRRLAKCDPLLKALQGWRQGLIFHLPWLFLYLFTDFHDLRMKAFFLHFCKFPLKEIKLSY